jgi:hypothetical protein
MVFGDEYELWNMSLWVFFQLLIISSILGQDILLSTLFSNAL